MFVALLQLLALLGYDLMLVHAVRTAVICTALCAMTQRVLYGAA